MSCNENTIVSGGQKSEDMDEAIRAIK